MGTESADLLAWRKAKRSVGNGACVEVAPLSSGFAVRDSKDRNGPVLTYSAEAWRQFVSLAKRGRYDAL